MVKKIRSENRSEWLEKRKKRIGGSDAATILGRNPWKTNTTLFEEKMDLKEPEDLSNNKAVTIGSRAEEYLRELFKLEYEDKYEVKYDDDDFSMWINDKYPFAHASLDGILIDKESNQKGILEIKTTTIYNEYEIEKWNEKIPIYYYIQCLHYLMVMDYDFVILKARIKIAITEEVFVRHYKFDRIQCREDIKKLIAAEEKFYQHMLEGESPNLILPEI